MFRYPFWLRKLKYLTTFKQRKQLEEILILSKLNYADTIYYPLTVHHHYNKFSSWKVRELYVFLFIYFISISLFFIWFH